MGRLESNFRRLYWPPLVRQATESKEYPGYRYEFFQGFDELNAYFTELCGADWYDQPWAEYWRNQHMETKNDDRREKKLEDRVKPLGNTGNRRDIKQIAKICSQIYTDDPSISSYKVARILKTQHDIVVHHTTVWRILKKLRRNNEHIS